MYRCRHTDHTSARFRTLGGSHDRNNIRPLGAKSPQMVSRSPWVHYPGRHRRQYAACSVAAINIAISGELTEDVPDCMSLIIGNWIIPIQDGITSEMRNSERWKKALVRVAGTGRNHERERLDMLFDWLWETVLPSIQPLADKHGFGEQWQCMCTTHLIKASCAASDASVGDDAAAAASHTAMAIECVASPEYPTANAATHVSMAATYVASATYCAKYLTNESKRKVNLTTHMAKAGKVDDAWELCDPIGLLERLIDVGGVHA